MAEKKINREEAVRGTGRNKLRTYRIFKEELKTEAYVNIIMPKHHMSALAKFKAGVAPLRIETNHCSYEWTNMYYLPQQYWRWIPCNYEMPNI